MALFTKSWFVLIAKTPSVVQLPWRYLGWSAAFKGFFCLFDSAHQVLISRFVTPWTFFFGRICNNNDFFSIPATDKLRISTANVSISRPPIQDRQNKIIQRSLSVVGIIIAKKISRAKFTHLHTKNVTEQTVRRLKRTKNSSDEWSLTQGWCVC